ncbi:unnamed protein product [Triticum turgidum subsp. durum]|uniref:Uncharacterized protein n=1 Tax=Triticum turgidum subsp. durum TaxID=4567 RepID=A0A9R0Y2J5_TRITD|nr:unnamed protein product [Triticum turgidum subsp. durum]
MAQLLASHPGRSCGSWCRAVHGTEAKKTATGQPTEQMLSSNGRLTARRWVARGSGGLGKPLGGAAEEAGSVRYSAGDASRQGRRNRSGLRQRRLQPGHNRSRVRRPAPAAKAGDNNWMTQRSDSTRAQVEGGSTRGAKAVGEADKVRW